MGKDVIIAMDFPNKDKTLEFLDKFEGKKPFVKIGMELFYSEGPDIIKEIKQRGHKIFLDLKLHDIPNTVKSAMKSLAKLDIDMVNVHAAGTIEMMKFALEGLSENSKRPLLIAVTQLTSTSEVQMHEELLIDKSLNETVVQYAKNTKNAGLDGVVCSPREAKLIHENCGDDFLTVTPGIRFTDEKTDDQTRITTPSDAKKIGSDYIVVGRPITKAENPVEVYEKILSLFLD